MNTRVLRRIPMFPMIPLVPMGMLTGLVIAMAMLFRRVRALEMRSR